MGLVGKGLGAINEAIKNSMVQLKLKDGQSVTVRILVPASELISVYEHVKEYGGQWHTITCLGKKNCPVCQSGDRARFVVYLPVVVREEDNKVMIFKATKRTATALIGLVEEYGDLTKRDFKIVRQGANMNTIYQFFPKDPVEEDLSKYELPDIEAMVEPLTREAILAIMKADGEVMDTPPENNTNENDFPF